MLRLKFQGRPASATLPTSMGAAVDDAETKSKDWVPMKMSARDFFHFFLSLIPRHPRSDRAFKAAAADPEAGMTEKELAKFVRLGLAPVSGLHLNLSQVELEFGSNEMLLTQLEV